MLVGIFALVGLLAGLFLPGAALLTIALALGALLLLLALHYDSRVRVRRAQAADPHTVEPYVVEFDDEGIRTFCDHVDYRIRWSGITRVVENPEFLLFVRGSSGGLPLPKRVLTPLEDQALRRLVEERVPKEANALQSHEVGA